MRPETGREDRAVGRSEQPRVPPRAGGAQIPSVDAQVRVLASEWKERQRMPGLVTQRIDTPIGAMRAVARDDGLLMCEYENPSRLPGQLERMRALFGADSVPGEHPVIDQTRSELEEYFAGTREAFTIPLVLDGTPFQETVWRALLEIPFGATTSYESIAARIGRPGAARAVG
ncbi:MAG: methylated-DNA--[protein]-cysteine S-methyltransferase, partial [Gemmatimonadaceae bacterium]